MPHISPRPRRLSTKSYFSIRPVSRLGKVVAFFADLRQQIVEQIHELQRHAASQRVPSERAAVSAGRNDGRGALAGDDGAQRQTGGEWFGGDDYVGLNRRFFTVIPPLESEMLAGTAEAGLNFVENQQGIVLLGKLGGPDGELAFDANDAPLAQDRLEKDPGGAVADGRLQRDRVVGVNEFNAGNQRFNHSAVLRLAGD